MNSIWNWVKYLGVIMGSFLAISGNSVIATTSQVNTLPENYNTLFDEHPSNANYSISNDPTQTQSNDNTKEQEPKNLVETSSNHELFIAGCITTNQGTVCTWP